ncbi:D-glucuronyl C5-epimerase family protein [Paracidovorax avenae]|uniref:D-glucuronyl C5-epimerase family protein n=1 Tax=Paracidovorax avenae TaxID=80867 RepID=UPI000D211B1E|nr:D-glucuronyl C5-epimerase family protein [Paracidovorax avenae]AVT11801.1 hypothetical protein C8235_02105 [Paracidovorax avenae]
MHRLKRLIPLAALFFTWHATADTPPRLQAFYNSAPPKYEWAFGAKPGCDPRLPGSGLLSPTKPAVRGLEAAVAGDLVLARQCEKELRQFARVRNGALFFAFKQDYIGEWPYHMHAPWVSALTQGVALELYMALAKATGESHYRLRAQKIFASYLVPINQGGFARRTDQGVVLEEYPAPTRIAVLNGGLVSAIALKDYADWSHDRRAADLFGQAAAWLERHISAYDVTKADGGHTSAYALAPRRLDVIFRFVGGTGDVEIDSISVSGQGFRHDIPVGDGSADQQGFRHASVITSPNMNWSQPVKSGERTTRKIIPGLGKFDHAPFRVQVSTPEELHRWASNAEITVTYRASAPIDLQINDGREYHRIAIMQASRGFTTGKFSIPQAAIGALRFPAGLVVNDLYTGYNQQLTAIFAEITGSSAIRSYSSLWR